MEVGAAFLYGVAGGVAAEILGLFKLRREGAPQFVRSIFYWLITMAMIALGGGLASLYVQSGVELTPILAVNVGASAPLILGQLAGQAPEVPIGRVD